ncbi:MAG: DUF3500 domain-containing protein [Pirellulaceae bacterium]
MRILIAGTVACTIALAANIALGQAERQHFVSDASFVIGTYEPKSNEHTPEAMANAAQALVDALDESQREQLTQPVDTDERREWTNLPARPDADGLRLGLMSEQQVKLACDLMATLFSEQGYRKMCNIMLADDQLLRGGRARQGFGTEEFSIVIFGEPSATGPWGFQLDGHHIGVNVSVTGEDVTLSPSFIGTQPEAFNIADDRIRPIGEEVDQAYALANSLTDDQRREAILRPERGQIITGPGRDNQVPRTRGVSCATFTDEQKAAVMQLIGRWVNDLPSAQAEKRMQQIESEMDEISFAWNGETEPGSDISWIIQGPSLIVEYACQDLGGNPLDHLHTIYRDPTNEYGGQLD